MFVIPKESVIIGGGPQKPDVKDVAEEIKDSAKHVEEKIKNIEKSASSRGRHLFGSILLVVGIYFILRELDLLYALGNGYLWAGVFLFIGLYLLVFNKDK